ncbi:hypothetical protein [Cellulomonas sp. Marseille-Q8402]
MQSTVRIWTQEEIAERRVTLLAESGLDLETLRERGETYQLSPEQDAILRELKKLDWLAGE